QPHHPAHPGGGARHPRAAAAGAGGAADPDRHRGLPFAAAPRVSRFLFHPVVGFGGADTSFPLFGVGVLVALGVDYNIFLMTRVREEAIRRDARHGAIVGMAATGGGITSAGFVLAGTFAVLATIPATFFTEIGFAGAFGILLDTIVVRLVLVTPLHPDARPGRWWARPPAPPRPPPPRANTRGGAPPPPRGAPPPPPPPRRARAGGPRHIRGHGGRIPAPATFSGGRPPVARRERENALRRVLQ